MKIAVHRKMIGVIGVLLVAFAMPSLVLAQATLPEKEFSLKPYFEDQGFKIVNYPCKVNEGDAPPTCLIEENDRIYLNNNNFDAFFAEKGLDFIVLNNEKALKLWGVNLYEDVVPEESPLFSYISIATYLKDDDGLSRFRSCVGKTLYPALDPTSRDAQGALARQWLCSRQNNLQNVLFLSPDFFLLPQPIQQDILRSAKNVSQMFISTSVSSQPARSSPFSWLFAGIMLLSIGTIFGGFLVKENIQQFMKKITFHWVRNFSIFLFLSPLLVGLLYSTRLMIPLKAFVFYLIFYFLASALLIGFSPWIKNKLNGLTQQCQLYDQKTHGKLRMKIQYIVATCGVLWLYSFFLFPIWQWLPLMGILFGTAGLIAMNVKMRDFLDCNTQIAPWFLYALKVLPLVLLTAMSIRYVSSPKQFTWEGNDFSRIQDVQFYTLDGTPLKAWPLSGNDGILLHEPILLSFTFPHLPLGLKERQALLSVTLQSDEALDLKPYNFGMSKNDSPFYLPRFDELIPLYSSPKEKLTLYRTSHANSFTIEPQKTIQSIIQEDLRDDAIISNLSGKTSFHFTKPTFNLPSIPMDPGKMNGTTWDIPLWGGNAYDVYLEVEQDTLSFELDVSHLPDRAIGVELLSMSLINSDDVTVAFDQKTIIHKLNGQQNETFRFEEKNLTPGLYRLTLQPVPIGTYSNSEVSTYRIDSMRSSSPVMMLYADKLAVAGTGTVFTRALGDEVYLKSNARKKIIPSQKKLQPVSFSEYGGTLISDEKLLFSQSKESWRSPFYAFQTKSLRKLTDYLIVESDLFDQTIRSPEGAFTFSRIFSFPAHQEKIQWLLTSHDTQTDFFNVFLYNVDLQSL